MGAKMQQGGGLRPAFGPPCSTSAVFTALCPSQVPPVSLHSHCPYIHLCPSCYPAVPTHPDTNERARNASLFGHQLLPRPPCRWSPSLTAK